MQPPEELCSHFLCLARSLPELVMACLTYIQVPARKSSPERPSPRPLFNMFLFPIPPRTTANSCSPVQAKRRLPPTLDWPLPLYKVMFVCLARLQLLNDGTGSPNLPPSTPFSGAP